MGQRILWRTHGPTGINNQLQLGAFNCATLLASVLANIGFSGLRRSPHHHREENNSAGDENVLHAD